MAFPGSIPRETAEAVIPRETAEDRIFTEDEHTAILADRVARETAAKDSEIERLASEKAALEADNTRLQNELDVAIAAREKAEKDLVDYKAAQEHDAELAELATTRTAAVRDAAQHLADDFFTAERASRWASMDQAAFDAYLADMTVAATPTAEAETAAAHSTLPGAAVAPKTGKSFWDFGKGGN